MKTSNLIDLPYETAVERIDDSKVEGDRSGWSTGLPEDPGETPPPLLTAIRAAVVLAVIGFVYLAVRYFSTR